MIISASRRTDIPAFYYPWLLRRFAAGEVWSVNPFNPRQITIVPLTSAVVDAVVLWSKNPAPILQYGAPPYPWYMQYTLNDYPSSVESNLPDIQISFSASRSSAAAVFATLRRTGSATPSSRERPRRTTLSSRSFR